ncbi:hypothetical protein [Pyrobaculum calidifontis]|uniref:Uncharacterized protein n=1 Tax=Pyrobaculum calidifontis (strain DSM 21063 / JCM 11548 / VA1) TaxID=410359 RepID=A3MU42_PYRCJ|nr:hypothetical protein [Pyrobaculum calidifontis]ABO08159.1 hypothetical protein Pcal_0733 [Pyrobaculum calidifontis JCM 11548]
MVNKTGIGLAVIALALAALAAAAWWGSWNSPPYGGMMGGGMGGGGMWGRPAGVPMGMYGVGGCPMAGWGGGLYVNDSNVVEYVKRVTGYEVISVEKYSNGYYVVVGIGGAPQREVLVFFNGVIHPEPQSMMWLGSPMRISEEEARRIAESWLASRFPGAVIEEEYTFPGYYTFHFEVSGDMQMLSVNGYSGAVWFHSWHGKYLGEVFPEAH